MGAEVKVSLVNERLPKAPKAKRNQREESQQREREFVDAVARVYRRYNGDIDAFLRDVAIDCAKHDKSSEP